LDKKIEKIWIKNMDKKLDKKSWIKKLKKYGEVLYDP
jgi:hypothetical protein